MIVDTSALLAALAPRQKHHEECALVLASTDEPRILSPFVLAELDYFIQHYVGIENELLFLDEVAEGVYDLAAFNENDVATARDVRRPISLPRHRPRRRLDRRPR